MLFPRLLLLCLILATAVRAGTVTLLPVADTFVQGKQYAASRFEGSDILQIKTLDQDLQFSRKGILKYRLAGLSGRIRDAKLAFTLAKQERGHTVRKRLPLRVVGVKDGSPGEDLDARTVTWDNLPWHDKRSNAFSDTLTRELGRRNVDLADKPAGFTFSFSNADSQGALLAFLQGDRNQIVTFGFNFPGAAMKATVAVAALEHATLAPVQLVLEVEDGFTLQWGGRKVGPVKLEKGSRFEIAGTAFVISQVQQANGSSQFHLRSERTGEEYGSFRLQPGGEIALGGLRLTFAD